MIKIALAFLLLTTFAATQNSQQYTLSPALPPTAFLGQYYTCDFRVAGLTNPKYTFDDLPYFFKASSSGRLEGTPTQKGTFTITVNYRQNAFSGAKSVLLRIIDSAQDSTKPIDVVTVQKNLNNIQIIPCVYSEGEQIFINLTKYIPGKHTWAYESLPIDLEGSPDGCLKGRFGNKGMYTFAAISSKADGSSSNYIFTLNIQPNYYNDYEYFGMTNFKHQASLVTVPIRTTCQCNSDVAFQLGYLAKISIDKALKEVLEQTKRVQLLKNQLLKINADVALANNTLKLANIYRDKVASEQGRLMKNFLSTREVLADMKNMYELLVINYNDKVKTLQAAKQRVKCAEQQLEKKAKILEKANLVFIKAQNDTAAICAEIQEIMLRISSAKEDVAARFELVKTAKKNLLTVQGFSSNQNFDIENLKTDKDIANMENDIATSQYHAKQAASDKALGDLKKASQELLSLRMDKQDAETNLGAAKFNLTQAVNRLLVAQAAKEQADKSLAIASAEAVRRPEGNSTYIFSGCQIGGYPSYAGSAVVQQIYQNHAVLSNGQIILYGACTEKANMKEGQLINFTGYYRNGVIHGISLLG